MWHLSHLNHTSQHVAPNRPLANEARLGRGGAGGLPGRLSGSGVAGLMRERAFRGGGSSSRSSLGKVAILNAEEAALEVGGFKSEQDKKDPAHGPMLALNTFY